MYTNLLKEEKIQVLVTDREVLIRSGFSDTSDLVWRIFNTANEGAFLVSRDLPLDAGIDYFYPNLHFGNDDYPAMAVENYSYISGNHGSVAAQFISVKEHPFREGTMDMGSLLTNEKGEEFILIEALGKENLIIHGVGKGDTRDPLFPKWEENTKLFYKGKELPLLERKFMQLFPLNRITKYEFLLDGKIPLEKNRIYTGTTLEFHFEHDVVSPLHLIDFIKENAGKKMLLPSFRRHIKMCMTHTEDLQKEYGDFMKLPALFTQKNLFTFQAQGCYTNKRKIQFHMPLAKANALDVMQIWNEWLMEQEKEEFYIPKMKDLTLSYKSGKVDVWKSNTIYQCPPVMDIALRLTKEKDALDPENPPERFIKLAGTNEKRAVGLALGYSLLNGFTAKENKGKDREDFYFLYQTKKLYPHSYTLRDIEPGKSMEIITYKHYFDPQAEPDATSFYFHKEGDSIVLYLDFHKKLTGKVIQLPASFAGKKISIVETTPGIRLDTKDAVLPDSTIKLDVTEEFGSIVLKLD